MSSDMFLSSWVKRIGILALILAVGKGTGPDPVQIRDFKAMSSAIAPSITTLLAMSLACMQFLYLASSDSHHSFRLDSERDNPKLKYHFPGFCKWGGPLNGPIACGLIGLNFSSILRLGPC